MTKQASRFARILLERFPDMPVTRKMLDALATGKIQFGRGVRKAEQARILSERQGPSLQKQWRKLKHDPNGEQRLREIMRSRMRGQEYSSVLDDLPPKYISGLRVKDLAKSGDPQARQTVLEKIKREKARLYDERQKYEAIKGRISGFVDPPISAEEFMRQNRYGETLYKGGLLPTVADRGRPIWFSGRPSIALGYAHPKGRVGGIITTARLRDSATYRRGKAFFSPHLAIGNRRRRIELNKRGIITPHHGNPEAARLSDYEMVLPADDFRRMPYEVYQVLRSGANNGDILTTSPDRFSQMPYRFRRVNDLDKFTGMLSDMKKSAGKFIE